MVELTNYLNKFYKDSVLFNDSGKIKLTTEFIIISPTSRVFLCQKINEYYYDIVRSIEHDRINRIK